MDLPEAKVSLIPLPMCITPKMVLLKSYIGLLQANNKQEKINSSEGMKKGKLALTTRFFVEC